MNMHTSHMFQALADPTRQQIIETLASKGRLPASAIAKQFTSSPPAISQHLKVLREAGVVLVEKQGQQRIYQLNPKAMKDLDDWVKRIVLSWQEKFNRLDILLESEKKKLLENFNL